MQFTELYAAQADGRASRLHSFVYSTPPRGPTETPQREEGGPTPAAGATGGRTEAGPRLETALGTRLSPPVPISAPGGRTRRLDSEALLG